MPANMTVQDWIDTVSNQAAAWFTTISGRPSTVPGTRTTQPTTYPNPNTPPPTTTGNGSSAIMSVLPIMLIAVAVIIGIVLALRAA